MRMCTKGGSGASDLGGERRQYPGVQGKSNAQLDLKLVRGAKGKNGF